MVLLSYVIPCLNSAATLKATLEAILKTRLPPEEWEVIVVDNGSSDRTVEIAKSYPVKVLHCPVRGAGPARNFGARHAIGEFLAFVDSDTEVEEDWAPVLLNLVEKKFFSAALGRVIPVGPETFLTGYRKALSRRRYRNKNISLFDPEGIGPIINTAACLYRRSVFLSLGGFDERLERFEDTEFSCRLFHHGGVIIGTMNARAYVSNPNGKLAYLRRSFRLGISKRQVYSLNGQGWKSAVWETVKEYAAPEPGSFHLKERLFYYTSLTLNLSGLISSLKNKGLKAPEKKNSYAGKLLYLFRLSSGNVEYALSPKSRALIVDENIYFFSTVSGQWQDFSTSNIPWGRLEKEGLIQRTSPVRNDSL
jgi:glycosyltransferase involved in cell wall biosynthesis